MKKVFTILIAIIMLASGMHVSIDRHYCGGELAGVKLSVTGKLASCGMEKPAHNSSEQPTAEKKCCDDQLTYYGIYSKYLPEYFRFKHFATGKDVSAELFYYNVFSTPDLSQMHAQSFPTDDKFRSAPSLSMICTFRI